MTSIFIDGQAGTTGLEISQRLGARNDIELLSIADDRRKDPSARAELMQQADLTVLCLPDAAAMEAVRLGNGECRLLDASTAYRTHPDWAYGCPELSPNQREAIRGSRLVSNPGCYPQGFVLLVRPLIEAGIVAPEVPLSVFGISGYSGGGRAMIEAYRGFTPEQAEDRNTRPYALGLHHKHLPEMHLYSGTAAAPVFSPAVGNYYRGMLVEIPLHRSQLKGGAGPEAVREILQSTYAEERFIQVLACCPEDVLEGGYLNPTDTNGTNNMQLMVFGNDAQVLLVARYDNLGKGASGAAVQNLNLMLGLDESLGLIDGDPS